MMVNIAKNIRQYSSEELRDLGYRGLLECNGFDLSDFVERIFSDYKADTGQDEIEEYQGQGYDSGYADGYAEAKSAAMNAVEDI